MDEKRIYVLVPQTVQIVKPVPLVRNELFEIEGIDEITNIPMVHGRLIAQGVHMGRLLGHVSEKMNIPYEDITAIVFSVRNSKELTKVSKEVQHLLQFFTDPVFYKEFHDTNIGLYGTRDRVHTITAFGPVTRESMESAIGHLQLY